MKRRLEARDLLKDAVFVNLEVFLLQVIYPFSSVVFDDDVNIDQFGFYLDLSRILRNAGIEKADHQDRRKDRSKNFPHSVFLLRQWCARVLAGRSCGEAGPRGRGRTA